MRKLQKNNVLKYGESSTICCKEDLLKYASRSLQVNKDFVIWAIKLNSLNIAYADPSLQNDVYLVTLAVQGNGIALSFLSEDLNKNKDVVYAAVLNDG